ncbi:MAG: acylphosphatase, partial [Gammaproteobacteria bacterium]
MSRERLHITITGAVQGVGFRPHVHGLARTLALTGFVRNRGADVEIEVEGDAPQRLLAALRAAPPPQASIEQIGCEPLPAGAEQDFHIAPSVATATDSAPPRALPDLACCPDCLRDVGDPGSRFYRYPFTNCSHCGPRYSIQRGVPYDRAQTAMAPFVMCADCRREYEDPLSRRFHAQPIACPACGPRLALQTVDGTGLAHAADALAGAAALVAGGGILALKGLGGYQLVVDAQNAAAVARLRTRKQRPDKPFAVMVANLATAHGLGHIDAAEGALLASTAAPIVLVAR